MARQWSKVRSDAVGTVLDEQGVARARKLIGVEPPDVRPARRRTPPPSETLL